MPEKEKVRPIVHHPHTRQHKMLFSVFLILAIIFFVLCGGIRVGEHDMRQNTIKLTAQAPGTTTITSSNGATTTYSTGMMSGRARVVGNSGSISSIAPAPFNTPNQATGTVMSVSGNGSSFVVAGYGSSVSIATTTTTQYQGGNTVKVNDTVTAIGTTNDGVLTATQVLINP